MRESEIERYFTACIRKIGGWEKKFISRGVPDRIVVFKSAVYFVELKAPGKKLSAHQAREHKRLINSGGNVWVLDSKETVDQFLEYLIGE